MLDIRFVRENPDVIKDAAVKKHLDPSTIDTLLHVDEERRSLIAKSEALRSEQKKTQDREKATAIKGEFKELEAQLGEVEKEFNRLMVLIPNIISSDTPIGKDESGNVEVERWGDIPQFDFVPKDHATLGKELDILDLERGAKVAGYRGYFLKNEGAMLVMALVQYALRKMVEKGFCPMIPPTLVKGAALFGSGYFKGLEYDPEVDEIYQVATSDKEANGETSRDKKFLVGTAEPSLLAYYSDEILKEEDLPIKVCGFSQCYRSEIGSYGKDTKGLYRVHEFMKVEQVVVSKADLAESDALQKQMVDISKEMHRELGLPYHLLQICTGDMGPGKYRQYDLEAWLPGMNRWAETGSASTFLDWQSRRLNVKYVTKEGEKKFAYLLNNTAMPSPRPFIAILENFQTKEGTVRIPEILQPYTGFAEIERKG